MEKTGRITLEIIARIRSDAPRGIEEFVNRYGSRLLLFIRYRIGDKLRGKVEPEDVLQDFFAAIVENREGFLDKVDDRGVHRTVFRMLENRIKDLYEHFYKTGKRNSNLEVREGPERDGRSFSFAQVAGSSASFRRRIEAEDEYQSLERILLRLKEPKRRLFVLKFVEELTNQEIAGEMGVLVSTVKRSASELVETIQRLRRRAGAEPSRD